MNVDQVIFILFTVFAVLGGLDRIIGNRFGLGAAFEKGFMTMGPLMLTMTGMIVLSPVLAKWLEPIISPLYGVVGADGAMFAGSFLACDMGGFPLATALASSSEAADLSGIITASMLGATITFTIPVVMGVVSAADRPYAAKGILCGIVTIPFGILLGGIILGVPLIPLLQNLIPILLLSAIIAVGLWKLERILIRAFTVFGRLMTALSILGLLLGLIESLTAWAPISGLAPINDAVLTVGTIALMLAGAFPLMTILTALLKKPLVWLGNRLSVSPISVLSLMTTSVNSIATFDEVKNMDNRGKVINMAFAVSAAFVFGDHLAYTAGVAPHTITALIAGKLTAGILAVLVALIMTKNTPDRKDPNHV